MSQDRYRQHPIQPLLVMGYPLSREVLGLRLTISGFDWKRASGIGVAVVGFVFCGRAGRYARSFIGTEEWTLSQPLLDIGTSISNAAIAELYLFGEFAGFGQLVRF